MLSMPTSEKGLFVMASPLSRNEVERIISSKSGNVARQSSPVVSIPDGLMAVVGWIDSFAEARGCQHDTFAL